MPRIGTVLVFTLLLIHILRSVACIAADEKPPKEESASVKDSEVNEFLRENNLSKSANTALFALRTFLARNLTPSQKQKVENQIARFEEIKKAGKVRFAGKWVEPNVAKAAAEKADQLIEQAFEKLKNKDGKGTLADLDKACKINPDGIRAYFILGMLFSLRGNCNPYKAEDYFSQVVKRAPDYAPALNNLAICEIKTRKYPNAFVHFRRAVALAPKSRELVQNISRVVSEVTQNQLPMSEGKVKNQKTTTRFDLFEKLAADVAAAAALNGHVHNPKVGWLFMPYVPTGQERAAENKPVIDANNMADDLIPLTQGTGFAIAPEVILTNRHVLDHEILGIAAHTTVQRPLIQPQVAPMHATVLALSNESDLALLHVKGANFTPVKFSTQPTKRGREVLVLGYPKVDFLGAQLKVTRGVVTAVEDQQLFGGMFMTDAEANPGNSGGPVCDKSASLMGVITKIVKAEFQAEIGDFSFAVPVTAVNEFLKTTEITAQQADIEKDASDWSEIDEKISPSVFFIENSYGVRPLLFREMLPEGIRPKESELEDASCSLCSGRGLVRCRAAGCLAGERPASELYTVTLQVATANMGVVRTQGTLGEITRMVKCGSCSGRGHLSCPLCKGVGVDPDLQ